MELPGGPALVALLCTTSRPALSPSSPRKRHPPRPLEMLRASHGTYLAAVKAPAPSSPGRPSRWRARAVGRAPVEFWTRHRRERQSALQLGSLRVFWYEDRPTSTRYRVQDVKCDRPSRRTTFCALGRARFWWRAQTFPCNLVSPSSSLLVLLVVSQVVSQCCVSRSSRRQFRLACDQCSISRPFV